ncbi:hypothetical protein [Streptomyces prasinopilosus]|uniref:Uncharacterized protein n=1 Tax=Streptomyces prasinopilosus TaxID=67344 RepID=A0A1G6XDN2_9ACTN|nr:hypothetical protein [Streptomyces prasinopilosus]SDD75477.1 hypothetical protein SAMN05216505_111156 [Streptomyces prasinopilosus]
MTVEVGKKDTVRPSETGWARARRLRGQGIRTCQRATIDRAAADGDAGRTRREGEWNVVRGED